MKIEAITPQIIALYIGQKCDFEREGKTATGNILGVFSSGVVRVTLVSESIGNEVEYNTRTFEQITPHLRSLDSLTEAEARELYEIETGETWISAIYCYDEWWNHGGVAHEETYQFLIGSPKTWLHLLSLGFDLFGLIEAGLAKEKISTETLLVSE